MGWGVLAMGIVGGSFAVSDLLVDYPVAPAQAARYLLGAAMLLAWARWRGISLRRPTRWESGRLVLLAAAGLTGFNVCVILGLSHAEPAAIGVVVGTTPLALAILAPLLAGRRPQARLVAAAAVVLVGVALVEGAGTTSLVGLLFSLGALAGEVAFTLLAVPLLPRLGAVTVSIYCCLLATGQMILVAPALAAATGTPVVRVPTAAEVAATVFLAVAVTAVGFVAWYTAVGRLGSERAGLLAGLMPVAALGAGLALGTGGATAATVAGAVLVGAGVASGLAGRRRHHPPPIDLEDGPVSSECGTPAAGRG